MNKIIERLGVALMVGGMASGFLSPAMFNISALGFVVFALGSMLSIAKTIDAERKG